MFLSLHMCVQIINSKLQPKIWQQTRNLGFKGLIKSKLKVIKTKKHLLFLKQHVKRKDVINVQIPNPLRFICGFLLVSNTIGADSHIIILSQY